jgi:hypothetical protein
MLPKKIKSVLQSLPIPVKFLQRKCVCGASAGLDGECEACRNKRLSLQRSDASETELSAVPPVVHEALHSPGQPLDPATRAVMEPRFGHDFSKVRVHTDARAAESAQAVNALAYTVGQDIVFGADQYAPKTTAGQKLLAHELTHVVQQNQNLTSAQSSSFSFSINRDRSKEREADSASRAAVSGHARDSTLRSSGLTLQRDVDDEEAERLHLTEPEFGFRRPELRLLPEESQLRLDPEIQAQIRAIEFMRTLLSPERILPSLRNIEPSQILGALPPPWLTTPAPEPKKPLVPCGAGPAEPRPGTASDIVRAITSIPAMETALTNLRTLAEAGLRHNWRSLSTGEKVLVVTGAAAITGGALAGILSDPEARRFLLEQVQDRAIPVPGVPGLRFRFNLTGDNPGVMFDLNVGRLLPESFGFR